MASNKSNILSEIFVGWKNYLFENSQIEIEAKRRIEICVENKCKKFTSTKTCNVCGCFMPAKVRSPKSKCPIGLW